MLTKTTQPQRSRPKSQTKRSRLVSGFSIVEFMVASLISTIIGAIVVSLFFNSLQAERRINQLSNLQINSQVALALIAETVELAGLTDEVSNINSREALFPADSNFGPGQALLVVDNGSRLVARMYGTGLGVVRDCNGVPIPNNEIYYRDIRLNSNDLVCRDLNSNLTVRSTTIIARSIEFISFVAELVDITNTRTLTTNMPPTLDNIVNISIDIISNEQSMTRTNAINTLIRLNSGALFNRTDLNIYTRISKVVLVRNIGQVVELS